MKQSRDGMSMSVQKFHRKNLLSAIGYSGDKTDSIKSPLPELKVRGLQSASIKFTPKRQNHSHIMKFYVNELQCVVYDEIPKKRSGNFSEYVFVDTYLDAVNILNDVKNGSTLNSESFIEPPPPQLPNLPAWQMRERMKKYSENQQSCKKLVIIEQNQEKSIQKRCAKPLNLLSQKSLSLHQITVKHKISAKRWCVFVRQANQPNFSKALSFQEDKICEVASITKVMTCYTALTYFIQNNINPEQLRIKIPGHAECMDGTSAFLNAGGILNAKQLMFAMMLPSGNDAALVLSMATATLINAQKNYPELWRRYSQGYLIDLEAELENNKKLLKYTFIQQMNENSQSLNMEQTCYNSVHGMNDQKNLTNAQNIGTLIQQCIKIQDFMDIVGTRVCKTHALNDKGQKSTFYKWKNTNKLLKKGWQGIKTGITTNAGPCFSGYYKNDQIEAIIIILNCSSMNQRWRDAENLLQTYLSEIYIQRAFPQDISLYFKYITMNQQLKNNKKRVSKDVQEVQPQPQIAKQQIQPQQQQLQQQPQAPINIQQVQSGNRNLFQQQIPIFGQDPKQLEINLNYQDDEFIEPAKEEAKNKGNLDIDKQLQFKVSALYKLGKLNADRQQMLPAMVSLIVDEDEQGKEEPQIGVDLICVIDKSGSMQGAKIKTLQNCLLVLLDFLSDKDRLCLIQFDSSAQRLTPLKKVTEANKSYFKGIINSIRAGGGTCISQGTQIALNQIKNRKYQNNVTSVFILSDGQDGGAQQAVSQQLATFVQPITIHSFGFGSDHDADMMTKLCDLRNGSFYFVENISLLDEFFVDALGGLVSVVADQIKIDIQSYPQQPFQEISIGKTYGAMWEKQKDREYKISLQQLATGKRKDYVFELMLPKFDQQIGDAQRSVIVVQAKIQLRNVNTKQIMEKKAELVLTFFNENENIPQNEQDVEVAVQYNRVKSADIIDDAQIACQNNNHELAQKMIQQTISEINKNPAVQKKSQFILEDLEQALEATKPQNFQNYGMKQMIQMKSNNYKQTGMNAKFVGGMQIQMDTAQFQNKKQAEWVTKVKSSKP
ncbi:hypothetical protein pb186bvf_010853 [Paramecium bursaria]